MTIYGFDQGYYFYAIKTSDNDFTVGEILDIQDGNGNRANANLMYWYLTEIENIEASNVKKYKVYPIRKSGDNTGNYVMYPDFRLRSSMVLVGLSSAAEAELRGPYLGGRILTESEASENRIITIGESDYNPIRHDLFVYQDDTKVFVKTQGDPFNPNFMSGTPFSAETLNYSCIPILNRQELAVPYVGTFSGNNRCGATLLTPWHVVTANHYPINAVETTLTFYNQSSDSRITKTISGSLAVSWYDIYANLGINWLKNNAGATNEQKYLWTHQTLMTYYSQNYGSSVANRFVEGLNDLRVLLLNSAVSSAVKPAKLPKFTDNKYSKLGYGLVIDQNQRGYLTPLKDNVASQSDRPIGGSSVLSVYAEESPLPNGTGYGDIFRNMVSGDSSSPVLSSYAGETVFLGLINSSSNNLESQISVVNGLPTSNVPVGKSNPAGSDYTNGCRLWMYLGLEIPETVESNQFPNPWYQNQDLIDDPGSYPQFILDLYNQQFLTDFPDVLRNPFSMIQTYINNWSRTQGVSGYPSTDVEFDVIDIVDDCPWFPCPDWKYYYRTSINQSVVAADLFQYDRAPRERVNLGSRLSPFTTTRIFQYSTNPGSRRVSETSSYYYALVRMNDEDATGLWDGWGDKEITLYRGNPATGTRAYPWESNPAVPSRSSPWHNIIYENIIGLYSWGFRSFMIYLPYASFSIGSALTYENMVNEYNNEEENGHNFHGESTQNTGQSQTIGLNTANYPSRWKGFFESLEALALGQMYPEGKDPISEPNSVMIYLPSLVAPNTTARTSSLSDYNRLGESEWLRRIDSFASRVISLHNKVKNTSKFSIAFDSASNSHTPSTSSDVFELGDWRLLNTLKQAGVNVYVTPRPSANSEWVDFNLWSDEHDLFVDATEGRVTDKGLNDVMRGAVRTFPIPANIDPYGTLTSVKGSPLSSSENQRNTPHYALFALYALSDQYRERERWEGYKFIRSSEIMVDPVIFTNASLVSLDSNGRYIRSEAQSFHSRTPYNLAKLENAYCNGRGLEILGYDAGYWFPEAITEWDVYVRKNSIEEFVEMIDQFSNSAGPINTASEIKYPNDSFSTKIIPSELREPFRNDLYTVEYISPSADVNNDGIVDSQDLSLYNNNPTDINGDGVVNFGDASEILSQWGLTQQPITTCTAPVISDPVYDSSKSVNYEIFGAVFQVTIPTGQEIETLVPMIFPGKAIGSSNPFISSVSPGSVVGPTDNQMDLFAEELSSVPPGRRVLDPRFWGFATMSSLNKSVDNYYMQTSDGILYNTNDSECEAGEESDPSTGVRFLGPWQDQHNDDTNKSFRSFLQDCVSRGLTFDYISDDQESHWLTYFLNTREYNTYDGNLQAEYENPNSPSWKITPDARRVSAIVRDPRFTTYVFEGKTFAQHLVDTYKEILGSTDTNITYLDIMRPWLCPTNREDFTRDFDFPTREAFNYCIRKLFFHYRKTYNAVIEEFPQYSNVKYSMFEYFPSELPDGRFVTELSSNFRLIPWSADSKWIMSPMVYGQVEQYMERHGISLAAQRGSVESRTWYLDSTNPPQFVNIDRSSKAFLMETMRVRVCAKNTPTNQQVEFVPWFTPPKEWASNVGFSSDFRYSKETLFHMCVLGALYITVWTDSTFELNTLDSWLKQWKDVSGNSRCQPVTRGFVDFVEAYEDSVVSGGQIMKGPNQGLYLWRITILSHNENINGATTLTRIGQSPQYPETISIPQGEVGTWLLSASSTPPKYKVVQA